MEDLLIQRKAFSLPGKKALTTSSVRWSVVLLDAVESSIERSKKTTKAFFRKKEKTHQQNTINGGQRCQYHLRSDRKGRKHNFRVFKESHVHLHPAIRTQIDSGYQGIKKLHVNSAYPCYQILALPYPCIIAAPPVISFNSPFINATLIDINHLRIAIMTDCLKRNLLTVIIIPSACQ